MIRLTRLLRYWPCVILLLTACASPLPAISDHDDTPIAQRADAHLQLALAYYQQQQWSTALNEVNVALQVLPQQAEAFSMRGLIYMASKRPQLAEADFLRALQIAPTQADYMNNYAWFLCQNGRAERSLAWFEKALASADYRSPATALSNAGVCSLSVTAGKTVVDTQMAEGYFLRALAQQPDHLRSHTELAKLYFNRGDVVRAAVHVKRAMALAQPTSEVLWLALQLAHQSGDQDTETALLTQLRRLYPDSQEFVAYQRGGLDE